MPDGPKFLYFKLSPTHLPGTHQSKISRRSMSAPFRRPHGGGYISGQGQQTQVNLPNQGESRDLNYSHAEFDHHGRTSERSAEVEQTPNNEIGHVELRDMQQQQQRLSQNHPSPFEQDGTMNSYPDLSNGPVSEPAYIQSHFSSRVDTRRADSYKLTRSQREIIIAVDRPSVLSNFLNKAPSIQVRKPQQGIMNTLSPGSSWRWKKSPHVFKHPSIKAASNERYRHRDNMARVYNRPAAERSLNPDDGKLTKLFVQTVDEIYNAPSTMHTWRRTYIRNVGPKILRAAYWPFERSSGNSEGLPAENGVEIAIKWLPACILLFVLLPWPRPKEIVTGGLKYHPFPYKYWGTCKVARNSKEDTKISRTLHWNVSGDDPQHERILRPRYLMFLNRPGQEGIHGSSCMRDDDWNAAQQDEAKRNLPYIFIAYTAAHFGDGDLDSLLEIAEVATRRSGLSAYWVSCSCMPEANNMEEDVYRINDVIRGAYSMVIALANKSSEPSDTSTLLREWGSRMWTFPEGLLSPNERSVEVYTRGQNLNRPLVISKKDLPIWAWDDAHTSRQIMDHFTGSLNLSRIELVNLGIKCLQDRGGTTWFQGDMAYALMGLLRRRPMVDGTDSQFQAFARLSLANDSDCLLERLICVAPKTHDDKWLTAQDSWDASLWDIYPSCQVAGVGENDTVILDGCRSATIHWDRFQPVAVDRHISWKRYCARFLVRISSLLVAIGAWIASIDPRSELGPSSTKLAGAFLLLIGLPIWLASPYLVKIMYSGKFWNQQAWLFGFEGHLDIATIESLLFGYNMSRLTWSPSGSPLSRHSVNNYNEWIGRDPTDDMKVQRLVQNATTARPGEMRIFTIVDTYTMTVTLIEARKPPVMVLLCASEGGMQRAVACSYQWRTGTLYKEAVMRMETQVLGRMERIGRVRFGFFRPHNDGFEV